MSELQGRHSRRQQVLPRVRATLVGCCPSCGNANPASAKFCLECGHRLAATGVEAAGRSATDTATPQPSQVTGSAERRQLTVMFCDLVGSTALSAQLDREDLREIISAYHHRCAEVIGTSGGFVAKRPLRVAREGNVSSWAPSRSMSWPSGCRLLGVDLTKACTGFDRRC
jgi:hypothetical protein